VDRWCIDSAQRMKLNARDEQRNRAFERTVRLSLTNESKRKLSQPNSGEHFHEERIVPPDDKPRSERSSIGQTCRTMKTHVRVRRFQVPNTSVRNPRCWSAHEHEVESDIMSGLTDQYQILENWNSRQFTLCINNASAGVSHQHEGKRGPSERRPEHPRRWVLSVNWRQRRQGQVPYLMVASAKTEYRARKYGTYKRKKRAISVLPASFVVLFKRKNSQNAIENESSR
jgi:hypothetical protein